MRVHSLTEVYSHVTDIYTTCFFFPDTSPSHFIVKKHTHTNKYHQQHDN